MPLCHSLTISIYYICTGSSICIVLYIYIYLSIVLVLLDSIICFPINNHDTCGPHGWNIGTIYWLIIIASHPEGNINKDKVFFQCVAGVWEGGVSLHSGGSMVFYSVCDLDVCCFMVFIDPPYTVHDTPNPYPLWWSSHIHYHHWLTSHPCCLMQIA